MPVHKRTHLLRNLDLGDLIWEMLLKSKENVDFSPSSTSLNARKSPSNSSTSYGILWSGSILDYKIQEARVQIDNGLKTANEWNRRSSSEASFASRPVCASVFRDTQDSLHLFFSNQTNNPTGVFCFGAKERQQMVKRANEFEYNFFSSSQRAMISRFWVVDNE